MVLAAIVLSSSLTLDARHQLSREPAGSDDMVRQGGSMDSVAFDGESGFGASGNTVYRLTSSEPVKPRELYPVPLVALGAPVAALTANSGLLVMSTSAESLCVCAWGQCDAETLNCADVGHVFDSLSADDDRVLAAARDGSVALYEMHLHRGPTLVAETKLDGQVLTVAYSRPQAVAGLTTAGDLGHRGAAILLEVTGDGFTELSRHHLGSPVVGVGIAGDNLIVAEAAGVISAFQAAGAGETPVDAIDLGVELSSLHVGDWIHLAASPRGDVFAMNVSDGSVSVADHTNTGEAIAAISGGRATVAAGRRTGGWLEFELTSTPSISFTRAYDAVGVSTSLGVVGTNVIVTSTEPQLEQVGLSFHGPVHESDVAISAPALAVAAADHAVYAAAGRKGLLALEKREGRLAQVAQLALPGWASDILVLGEFGYAAAGDSGVAVLSLEKPSAPSVIGAVDGLGDIRVLGRVGPWLAAADIQGTVHLLDLSSSDAPRPVASLDTGRWPTSLSREGGDTLFVGTATGYVQVWDISLVDAPARTGQVRVGHAVRALSYNARSDCVLAAAGEHRVAKVARDDDGRWALVGVTGRHEHVVDVASNSTMTLFAEWSDGLTVSYRSQGAAFLPTAFR